MTRVQLVSGDLLLPGPSGGLRFPAMWLRDNCPGPEGCDPRSGQKLFGITDIPNGIVVTAADLDALASSLAVLERAEEAA
jgi:hypothetical protein